MLKLLAISDMNVRGVTVNRLDSLERLAENGHQITTKVRHKYPRSWDIDWCDCIFFLRAIGQDDLNFIKECKLRGKKIWVDTDDDLLHVPSDHDGYFSMRDPNLHAAYREIHRLADHVTFSTKVLAQQGLAKNWSVIPCSYPDEIINQYLQPGANAKTVLWRGTTTHDRSLREFGNAIVEVMRAHQDWRIEFIGTHPYWITDHISNWYVHGFFDVVDLLQKISEIRASVHIVPRVSDPFTQARSSVSYVEAACGGGVTVSPGWPEWQLPGTLNYNSVQEFADQMHLAMNEAGTQIHQARWQKSARYIRQNRIWSVTNKMHAKVLYSIMQAH